MIACWIHPTTPPAAEKSVGRKGMLWPQKSTSCINTCSTKGPGTFQQLDLIHLEPDSRNKDPKSPSPFHDIMTTIGCYDTVPSNTSLGIYVQAEPLRDRIRILHYRPLGIKVWKGMVMSFYPLNVFSLCHYQSTCLPPGKRNRNTKTEKWMKRKHKTKPEKSKGNRVSRSVHTKRVL